MTTSHPFPPSARDFLAYQRVVIEMASTRQVAGELEISQTRVRQIVRRVGDWLEETVPAADENREAARLRVAQHIAADRLDRYLREADHAWRQTRETKYANLVLRVLAAQIKLPAMAGTLEALAMDAILGPLPEAVGQTFLSASEKKGSPTSGSRSSEPAEEIAIAGVQVTADKNVCPTASPPLGDCSPGVSQSPPAAADRSIEITATPQPNLPSDNRPAGIRAARNAFLTPAHLRPFDESDDAVTEIKITPQTIRLQTNKPKNRRERRRLKRLASKT